jgi:hypothetical protein
MVHQCCVCVVQAGRAVVLGVCVVVSCTNVLCLLAGVLDCAPNLGSLCCSLVLFRAQQQQLLCCSNLCTAACVVTVSLLPLYCKGCVWMDRQHCVQVCSH